MSGPAMRQEELSIFTIDTLIKYMGNDDEAHALVRKIVADAVSGGSQPMQLARLAVRDGRYDEVARIFHGLRGSIGTLGAKRFVAAALAVEVVLVEQRLAELPDLFARADAEFMLALEHADAWLARHTG
ncbi:HPt (histidine-containing phosphotransfer) domain-containing protein [Oxalobacteraceae bacterium GrIS 1.11]